MLITGRVYLDIECWWLGHNEQSNVLVLRNHRKRGILNLGIKIWYLSGKCIYVNHPKLHARNSGEFVLNEVPQWNELRQEDTVAVIELIAGEQSLCFKNITGKLTATSGSPGQIIRACQTLLAKYKRRPPIGYTKRQHHLFPT